MTFSISIGAYGLPQFLELNLRACRDIFGSSPILVYSGMCRETNQCKEIADRFDASFLTEERNRGHWQGCVLNAICSIAFARANQCKLSVKLNQRLLLCSETIPDLIEDIFSDPKIDLAMPPAIRVETIQDERSKFHARFPRMVDCIVTRANAVDPEMIAQKYDEQVKTGINKSDALSESYWDKLVKTEFVGRFKDMPFLSEPQNPPLYLRKAQATSEMYQAQAIRLGMEASDFPCEEWSAMLGSAYRPLAAFG